MALNIQQSQQKGFTLSGMMFWSVVLILAAVLGMKVTPVYIENATIKKNLVAVSNDPSLQNANARQIRLAFSKRAQIDAIREITAKDIKISRDKGQIILGVNYSVNVPLFANISLQIDFDTTSE